MQTEFSNLFTCRSTGRHILVLRPAISKLRVPQPFITYAFDVNIYFYSRSCVATRPPFTFSHICLGKNKEQKLICSLFQIYMQKLICFSALTAVTQTCLVIHLFLSHNLAEGCACGSAKNLLS